MKARFDFVSNSSSCSFILKAVSEFVKLVNETVGDAKGYLPYDMIAMNVSVYGAKDNVTEAAKLIAIREESRLDEDDVQNAWDDEDENLFKYDCSFESLLSLPDEILVKLSNIRFEADDCEQNEVLYLTILYKLAETYGLEPDASMSERSLPFADDNNDVSALGRLIAAAFSNDYRKELT